MRNLNWEDQFQYRKQSATCEPQQQQSPRGDLLKMCS